MATLLERFESAEIDPAAFGHERHIEVGVELLRQTSFLDAARRYMAGLHSITSKVHAAEKVNLTVTVAFLAALAERLAVASSSCPRQFKYQNADLFAPDYLAHWYSPARLANPLARTIFLLPDRRP